MSSGAQRGAVPAVVKMGKPEDVLRGQKTFREAARKTLVNECNEISARLAGPPLTESALKALKRSLSTKNTVVEGYNSRIEQVMCDLNAEEQEIADEAMNVATLREEVERLNDAIEERLTQLSEAKEQLQLQALQQLQLQAQQQNQSLSHRSSPPSGAACSLPRFELEKFNGDSARWGGWWAMFEEAVDKQSCSDAMKLAHLQQCVTGEAKDCIKGFVCSSENYPIAVAELKRKFGDVEDQKRALLGQLLHLKPVLGNDPRKLRSFVDSVQSNIRSLDGLAVSRETYDLTLKLTLLDCVSPGLRTQWFLQDGETSKTARDLLEFLERHLRAQEKGDVTSQPRTGGAAKPPSRRYTEPELETPIDTSETVPTGAALMAPVQNYSRRILCTFCDGDHLPKDCGAPMTVADRLTKARKKRACFKCGRIGHRALECRSAPSCSCGGKHIPQLCQPPLRTRGTPPDKKKKNHTQVTEVRTGGEPSGEGSLLRTEGDSLKGGVVAARGDGPTVRDGASSGIGFMLLRTAAVRLNGRQLVRALADTGCSRTFVRRKDAQAAGARVLRREDHRIDSFGGRRVQGKFDVVELTIEGLQTGEKLKVEALVTDDLAGAFSRVPSEWYKVAQKEGLHPLADFVGEGADELGVIFGEDVYDRVVPGPCRVLSTGARFTWSIFGWLSHGSVTTARGTHACVLKMLAAGVRPVPASLWDLETLGIQGSGTKREDEELAAKMELDFESGCHVLQDGRYEVSLPRKPDVFPDKNRDLALGRLRNMMAKKGAGYREKFDHGIREMVESGVAERAPEGDQPKSYLPLQGVVREGKPLRIVLDASAKRRSGISVNDALESGPNLVPDLLEVLARFRKFRIPLTADLTKAFLQVAVAETDRDILRFLWFKDESGDEVVEYRMKRLPFGLTCSPYLLQAVLRQHFSRFPEVEVYIPQWFVDDFLAGHDTIEEAMELKEILREILGRCQMEITKWSSTYPELEDDVNRPKTEQKVLGMKWLKRRDELAAVIPPYEKEEIRTLTKRAVLQQLAGVFDPLGIVSPWVLTGKQLFQDLCRNSLEWDQPLGSEQERTWEQWIAGAKSAAEVTIPRYIGQLCNYLDLVAFCDASEKSYGVVIYGREKVGEGIRVHWLGAKTRLAPLARVTLARLELLAALIAARFADYMAGSLGFPMERVQFFTDSQVVLGWLSGPPERWKAFVRSRVREIGVLTSLKNWHHCPGNENPADIVSRGVWCMSRVTTGFWIGPPWLETMDKFSELCVAMDRRIAPKTIRDVGSEEAENVAACVVADGQGANFPGNPGPCGSWTRLIRVVMWMHRFVTKCRRGRSAKPDESTVDGMELTIFTSVEKEEAENCVLKQIQQEAFPAEIEAIRDGQEFERSSPLNQYGCRLDGGGLVVTSSRAGENGSCDRKIVLPSDCMAVRLLVVETHRRLGHQGVAAVLNRLRQKYWIIRGRSLVKAVVKSCAVCRQFRSVAYRQVPTLLPSFRVEPAKPFRTSGVDLFGPMYVAEKGKEMRMPVYGCLFTCPSVRAVHIELVQSQSAVAFLRAFRRFYARRGPIQTLYSDNAGNFQGAVDALQSEFGVTSRFIPPRCPMWGGWWERMVGVTKAVLKRVMGRSRLTLDELTTVLVQTEGYINARPLTVINDDMDREVITPACFLGGIAPPPAPAGEKLEEYLLRGIKILEDRARHLWKIWTEEYLSRLETWDARARRNGEHPRVGDLVLMNPESALNKGSWPLARVVSFLPSRDGFPRIAEVKTASGVVLRRSTTKLHFLESSGVAESLICEDRPDLSLRSLESVPPRAASQTEHSPDVSNIDKPHAEPVRTRAGRLVRPPVRLEL